MDAPEIFIHLIDELARTRGRATGAFREIRQAHDLTELELVVLNAVAGAKQPPTVPQIGRSLGHPRQMIQRAADTLAGRGLIDTQDNTEHKRAKLLVLTTTGWALKAGIDADGLQVSAMLTQGMDAQLLARTVAGLRTIRETIEYNLRRHEENLGGNNETNRDRQPAARRMAG